MNPLPQSRAGRRVGEIDAQAALGNAGLRIHLAPFVCHLRSRLPVVAAGVAAMYADYPIASTDYADFHVSVEPARGLRRFVKPQCVFDFDGTRPFYPLPSSQAYALLEWGLNWSIGNHAHRYLILHAGMMARGDAAVVLPGNPGSGKSTLCAALMLSGYRLLSDELTLITDTGVDLHPSVRPISLKNQSIDVVRALSAGAILTQPARDTAKGTVAHLRPAADAVRDATRCARARLVVFPKFRAGVGTELKEVDKADAFMRLVDAAFNYHLLGEDGFERLRALIDAVDCYAIEYGDMDEALRRIEELLA
jgi:hypothetical protein